MSRHHAWKLALVVVCVVAAGQSIANERVKSAVDQLAGDDLLVAAAIELDSRWVTGLQKEIATRVGEEGNAITGSPAFAMTLGFVESFRSAGGRELVMVLGAGDLNPKTGPIFGITTESPEQANQVRQLLEGLRAMTPGGPDLATSLHGSLVLVGQKPTVERYAGREPAGESAAANQLAHLLEGTQQAVGEDLPTLALVVAPSDEPRRVIRALWPALPKPFDIITGEMLADDVRYVAVRATCPPKWELKVIVDTINEHAAEQLQQSIQAAWQVAVQRLQVNDNSSTWPALEIVEKAASVLVPRREGATLEISASHDDPQIVDLTAAALLPPIEAAREAARRSVRMNNLKQMALAMHNHHDTLKSFPASSAIVDQHGKPLLSWRVAVLPFIEGQTLYNQFHLDEPWNSPHNLKLLTQMPEIYQDASHPELAPEGKTTYELPVHPQSAFPPLDDTTNIEEANSLDRQKYYRAEGTDFKQIKDGTSNTVMIVQVPPELAVPWTKPADWEVDLAKAWEQLRGAGREIAIGAKCDGSAHVWDLDNEKLKENLPKMITRDGGEVVER